MFIGDVGVSNLKVGDNQVDKIYLGDDVVWTSFEPFYWINNGTVSSGYPSSYTDVKTNSATSWAVNTTISGMQGRGESNWSIVGTTIPVSTLDAKYIDVVLDVDFSSTSYYNIIGVKDGVETTIKTVYGKTDTYNLDISMYDSVKLNTVCAAYATNWGYAHIKTIYFHD